MNKRFPIHSAQQLTEYVRALRKSRGLTQADVAKRLGVSKMRVATIEKDVGRLSSHRLIVLLQLLGAQLELHIDDSFTETRRTPLRDSHEAKVPGKGEW